jgi:hypothetical protein
MLSTIHTCTSGEARHLVRVAAALDDHGVDLEDEAAADPDHGERDVDEQQELVQAYDRHPNTLTDALP